ncbi:hypothetical protein EB796_002998 [Bugula neritina]|uniref:Uncharacterized protein n=1 Tax=Bugula neritina TaxID=10212 RepID=A0A7J7KKA9_BUGNE|nr:hypothetical protein EB796_002998 [Bugula neritina]
MESSVGDTTEKAKKPHKRTNNKRVKLVELTNSSTVSPQSYNPQGYTAQPQTPPHLNLSLQLLVVLSQALSRCQTATISCLIWS